ncbi:MAG: hypothetical protein RDV48_09885 [Candidatus Eremiobacteraeota bacterium]|nr:hypothetical protein [Candidatus Eremiobacteraeota bacterium]
MRRAGKKGISLLEIIIAMGILAFMIFSIGVLIPLSQTRSFNYSNRETALSLAENMLEKIKALNFSDIVNDATYDGELGMDPANKGTYYQYPPAPYPSTSVDIYYPGPQSSGVLCHTIRYYLKVNSCFDTDANGIPLETLKKVTVKVTWNQPAFSGGSEGGKLQNRSITLSSKVLER